MIVKIITGHASHSVWIPVSTLEMAATIMMPSTLGVHDGPERKLCFQTASSRSRGNGSGRCYHFVPSCPPGIRWSSWSRCWDSTSGRDILTGEVEPSVWLWYKRPCNCQPFAPRKSLWRQYWREYVVVSVNPLWSTLKANARGWRWWMLKP